MCYVYTYMVSFKKCGLFYRGHILGYSKTNTILTTPPFIMYTCKSMIEGSGCIRAEVMYDRSTSIVNSTQQLRLHLKTPVKVCHSYGVF